MKEPAGEHAWHSLIHQWGMIGQISETHMWWHIRGT